MGRFSGSGGAVTFVCECGKSTQRPLAQLHKAGKCGGCKAPIDAPAQGIAVDTKTFEKIVKMAKVPTFVDFWATWCAPCKQVAPDVERLAASWAGRALVLKVDTEANPTLSAKFQIRSIPTFMIFARGAAVDQRVGAMSGQDMQSWLRNVAS